MTVSTRVQPHELPARCVEAVRAIFPDGLHDEVPEADAFPVEDVHHDLSTRGVSPDKFLEMLTEQRILDTALDAMALNLHADETVFLISRQAALKGKVAFVLPSEITVGGVIEVHLEGADLADWIEEATWHAGRREVPRVVGDEVRMRSDGAVNEWFDKHGQPTMQTDQD